MSKALTVRLDDDMHRQLGIHRALTGEPAQTLVTRLLAEYLAGPGRDVLVAAGMDTTGKQYRVALDKLAQ